MPCTPPCPHCVPLYAAALEGNAGASAVDPLPAIRQAIADYHYALDTRQHGGVAQDKAFNEICTALGLHWRQGEEKARRNAGVDLPDGAQQK